MMEEKQNEKLPLFGIPALMPYLKPYFPRMVLMISLGLIASAFDSILPLFNRYALDHFIGEGVLDTLKPFIALYIFAALGKGTADYISLLIAGSLEMNVNRDLRNASFNHIQTLSFSYFNQNSVGYIHARVMSDTGKIGELVAWRMMDVVWNVSYIIAMIVVMFTLNVRLAVLFVIIVPIAMFIIVYFGRKYMALNRMIREINRRGHGNGFPQGYRRHETYRGSRDALWSDPFHPGNRNRVNHSCPGVMAGRHAYKRSGDGDRNAVRIYLLCDWNHGPD